jgi:UrcA family protein
MKTIALACALAAAVAAGTPALAGEAKLTWKDLDLATPGGRSELDRRIEAAAQQVCAPEAMTGSRLAARGAAPGCLAEARETIAAQVAARTGRPELAGGARRGRTADAR